MDAPIVPARPKPIKEFFDGLLAGTLTAVLFGLGGFLAFVSGQGSIGVIVFGALPFATGFAVAAVARKPGRITASCVMGAFFVLTILIISGREGFVCALMALPPIAAGMILGGLAGYYSFGRRGDHNRRVQQMLLLLALPALLGAGDRIEKPSRVESIETFTSDCFIAAEPERVWTRLGAMGEMSGEPTFLMKLGLPLPRLCEMQTPGVGGTRICHFDQGEIFQRITVWQPPTRLGIEVAKATLPGRHWLSYHDCEYELIPEQNGTRVVRHTSIGSRLYPRWYWRPLEEWGVLSEHAFVFGNLKRKAEAPPVK